MPSRTLAFLPSGDINAFSLTLYFWALGVTQLSLHSISVGRPRAKRVSLAITIVFLSGLVAGQGWPVFQHGLKRLLGILPENPQQIAFNFARQHPGEAYFPWNPLSTLMAEKKLYHFEPALGDWAMAGYPINQTRYAGYVPNGMRYVAYAPNNEFPHLITEHYLPAFSQRVSVPDLPGWLVYARPIVATPLKRAR